MGVCFLLAVAACGGSETGNTGGSGSGTGGHTGGTGTGGATGGTGTGGSTGGTGPSCSALSDAVRVSHVTAGSPALSNRAITAQRGEGSVVAWAANDGKVHAQPLDANDAAMIQGQQESPHGRLSYFRGPRPLASVGQFRRIGLPPYLAVFHRKPQLAVCAFVQRAHSKAHPIRLRRLCRLHSPERRIACLLQSKGQRIETCKPLRPVCDACTVH